MNIGIRLRSIFPAPGQLIGVSGDVLFFLEQRAEEGQSTVELDLGDAGLLQNGDPVDELAGRGALAQAARRPNLEEGLKRLLDESLGEIGMVHTDDAAHELSLGE